MSDQIAGSAAVDLPATARGADAERSWVSYALWLLPFACVWFASLGFRSLVNTDEGRYAVLALEVARSGDWITPRLNGFLYFEKPPLQYWIGALSFRLFGINEFAARLWPGLAGFLTVLAVGYTAGRLWGRAAGVRALAIAASTTWIFGISHVLTLDAGLTVFLTVTLCAVLLAECTESTSTVRRRWIWAAWVSMASAVLSKGPVGAVIPGCALLLASLWTRDFALLRRLRPLPGSLILLAIAAPWFVMVSLRNRGFAEFFFIHEHVARYLTTVHHRIGAWWYYLPLLLLGLLPWTSGLPWMLRRARPTSATAEGKAVAILVAWAAFVLLFFSASSSKLPAYILPIFPALALLLTRQLRNVEPGVLRWHLWLPTVLWVALLLASTQTARLMSADVPSELAMVISWAFRIGALLFLVGALVAWWHLGRRHITAAVLSVALGHLAGLTALLLGFNAYGQLKSADALSRVVVPLIGPDTPVFAVRSYDQTLPFYFRRHVVLVDFVNEFEYGEQHEPGKSIATLEAFIARWQGLPQGAAYMTSDTWRQLRERGVPMRVVFEDPRRLVVIKP